MAPESEIEKRLDDLERKAREQDRTITGLQNELIKAGKYEHDNPVTRLEGVQVLLRRAGEYKGRKQRDRNGR